VSPDLDHIVLTRFNLPSAGVESVVRARDGWLRDRTSLFERYCAPSVAAQSVQRFTWVVYFDPQSPPWLKQWIEVTSPGLYHPIFRAEVSRSEILADATLAGARTSDTLLTTNLDNDDAIGRDFVARLQAASTDHRRAAIYLTKGLIRSPHGLFQHTDRHNAFCSVREDWDDAVTCWSDWHNRLRLSMPAVELDGEPAWLQVVHGANVSNRVRGRRVSPSPFRSSFPGLEDVAEPTGAQLWHDRLVDTPTRSVYESMRAAVKRAALQVLGKNGLDRAKSRWAGTGST